MLTPDPSLPLRDWRASLFRGNESAVERFLDAIDSTLPQGWVRDQQFEKSRLQPDRIRCYLRDQPNDAAVRVWLQLVAGTRVRGGPVQLLRHPPSGDAHRVGKLVAEFSITCVLPAAYKSGLARTQPMFGPRSALTPSTEMLFTRFADVADGQWPLREKAQPVWEELVSTCLAEQVAINRGELDQWLADSGWEPGTIAEISQRFYADSQWLASHLGATAP